MKIFCFFGFHKYKKEPAANVLVFVRDVKKENGFITGHKVLCGLSTVLIAGRV